MLSGMIHGIQHIGLGVRDFDSMWAFYRDILNFNVPMSRDRSQAARMEHLTGGSQERKVVIALNLLGGGMIEILQFTSKDTAPSPPVQWGNTGFLSFSLKVRDIDRASQDLRTAGVDILTSPTTICRDSSSRWRQMYFRDPEENILGMVESPEIGFSLVEKGSNIGGILFPTVGVSDMEESLRFYREILGYKRVIFDWEGVDEGLRPLPGADRKMRRVLVTREEESTSLFRYYLRSGMIELVQVYDSDTTHLYSRRGWGDQGIMELCFDVNRIGETYSDMQANGARGVLEPNDEHFRMGNGSSALFAYVSDPDGTWIELAEVISFPIFLGMKFNLQKRTPDKPLSPFLLKLLRFAKSSG